MRFGLTVSILLGGLISMGILVVGSTIEGGFGFDTLTQALTLQLGSWARGLFGAGLFAAGLSSAITAPLAAAVTARSLFGAAGDSRWDERSWRYRGVWLGVLAVGVGFGMAGVRPVPAILVAQALNGVLLPFVAVFLLLAVNDRRLMGATGINSHLSNRIIVAVVAVSLVLGVAGLVKAAAAAASLPVPGGGWMLAISALAAVGIVPLVRRRMLALRRGDLAP